MQRTFGSIDLQTVCVGDYREASGDAALAQLTAGGPAIARGAGVSFVGASFGEDVRTIGMGRMTRVLELDSVARRVHVEAGLSLGALYRVLTPHRLYLRCQPGHPQISVGGCVASNVHGKNPQRDGVFADVVESLRLFHPEHGLLDLSRERHPDLFELTCGGFGLTGIIVSVTLRLNELPSSRVEVRWVPVAGLEETCEQIEMLKSDCDFLYTWNDFATFGKEMGRGYVCCARFVESRRPPAALPDYRALPARYGRPSWPRLLRRGVIGAATRSHFHWRRLHSREEMELFDMLYPGMYVGSYYFDSYGADGFFAHMVLIPRDRWREYVHRLEAVFRRHREPILALVLKAFEGPQRLLGFNGTGFSLHAHVPNSPGGRELLGELERLSDELGTIRTLYFDARLGPADARRLYPEYDEFKQRLHRFDPRRMFQSSLSRRLGL